MRFEPPFGGLRDNVRCSSWAHCKARSGLLVLIELFSAGVTAEALRAKINKILAISLQRGQFDPKFQVKGDVPGPPPIIFAWIVRPMNALQLCR